MNLRDKLDRYGLTSGLPKAGPRAKAAPPCPTDSESHRCEHTRHVFPSHHKHGIFDMASLGGHLRNAANLLAPSAFENMPAFDRIAFVDTETTGLSGGIGVCAFLVGIGYRSPDGFVVEQFLMNDFPAEPDMLHKVSETLDRFDVIASYNGRAFDIPILEGRLLLNGIRKRLTDKPHLDLLHPARRIWKHRLSDCSLKTIEEHVLGCGRIDDIDGWMIPQTFFEYLTSGDRELLEPILSHNRLDILSLACLAHLILGAVEKPQEAPLNHAPDWFGLGTLFEQRRRTEEAVHCFDRARAMGLPEDIRPRCLKLLSLTHKRKGDWENAVSLWNESTSAGNHADTLFALEELAKFYEHRRRDLLAAREVCRRAITILEIREATSDADPTRHFENFEYRRRRIEKKIRSRKRP